MFPKLINSFEATLLSLSELFRLLFTTFKVYHNGGSAVLSKMYPLFQHCSYINDLYILESYL